MEAVDRLSWMGLDRIDLTGSDAWKSCYFGVHYGVICGYALNKDKIINCAYMVRR